MSPLQPQPPPVTGDDALAAELADYIILAAVRQHGWTRKAFAAAVIAVAAADAFEEGSRPCPGT